MFIQTYINKSRESIKAVWKSEIFFFLIDNKSSAWTLTGYFSYRTGERC